MRKIEKARDDASNGLDSPKPTVVMVVVVWYAASSNEKCSTTQNHAVPASARPPRMTRPGSFAIEFDLGEERPVVQFRDLDLLQADLHVVEDGLEQVVRHRARCFE